MGLFTSYSFQLLRVSQKFFMSVPWGSQGLIMSTPWGYSGGIHANSSHPLPVILQVLFMPTTWSFLEVLYLNSPVFFSHPLGSFRDFSCQFLQVIRGLIMSKLQGFSVVTLDNS